MDLEQELAPFRADFARTAPEGRVALHDIGKAGRVLLASLHFDDRTRLEPEAILVALRTARS